MFYVYYLLDPETLELLYIGRSHRPQVRCNAFKSKYGIDCVIGISQRFSDFERACKAEVMAIKKHWPPYNKHLVSSKGRFGLTGFTFTHSPETKNLISLAGVGRKQSEETIAKRIATRRGSDNFRKGIPAKPEHVAKRAAALTGHITSEQTKRKISKAQAGRKVSETERQRLASIAKNRLGRKCSAETIAKMKQSALRREANKRNSP